MKLSVTAYQFMVAPMSITSPDNTAVKRTPILSRMIPANIRKKTNTLRNVSDPCIVPKAVESQPRVDCIRSFIGERMSMNMYEQNMAKARNMSTIQRMAAESLSVVLMFSVIFLLCFYIYFYIFSHFNTVRLKSQQRYLL